MLDIIPGNLVEPFATDNHLQVIVLAIFTGIILLLLGDASRKVSQALEQLAIVITSVILHAKHVTKLPVRSIIGKQKEPLLINLSTSSQVAAFPYSVNCCKNLYGIDNKLVDFALPIEMVAYMPCGSVMFIVICFTLMSIMGLPLVILMVTVCGYFLPLFNGFLMELELLMAANKEGKVDKDILMKSRESQTI